jgi:hypothetical protein
MTEQQQQKKIEVGIKKAPAALKDEITELKLKLDSITEMFYILRKRYSKKKEQTIENDAKVVVDNDIFNKDGVPLNSSFIGFTQNSRYPYILIVDENGDYKVGSNTFPSLSASAEFVSGVRRSGWTFWKLLDGRTLKEVYKVK